MATKLGDEIKMFRKKHECSLESFANMVGCSKSYLSMIERGEDSRGKVPDPSTEILKNLSRVMNISLDDLLEMSSQPSSKFGISVPKFKIETNPDGTLRFKAVNGEVVCDVQTDIEKDPHESRAYQREFSTLSSYIKDLNYVEIKKLRQIVEIMFSKQCTPDLKQSKFSENDYSLKKKHFQEIFKSDETTLSLVECLEQTDQEEYKSILDSCELIWGIKNDNSEAVTQYYDNMIQSMKDEIIRKVVAKLARNNGK